MPHLAAMEFLLDKMRATRNNAEFFDPVRSGK
jgi:transcription termination factor Rho